MTKTSLLLPALLSVLLVAQTTPSAPMTMPTWKEIDAFVADQKMEAANQGAQKRLEAAIKARDEAEWTRALVKTTQLRISLHGYETAVRALKSQPWPKGLVHRATLNLFYAAVLNTYAHAYSWEIRQREHVDSKEVVDLKAWTLDQLSLEAQKAFQEVWLQRTELSNEPITILKEYVDANNYPQGIRDTQRDLVSYLRVEALRDTSHWTAAQSNDVFRLDLGDLLKVNTSRGKDAAR